MKGIKILLQNKKVQAAALILLVCILFVAVLISNRSGKNNSAWNYKEVSNSDADEQETTIITEEITREIEAEVETDASGKIFSILVEDETIDLASNEIETEEKPDGSVTYKVKNDTEVVVNKDGTAKVIKKETVTKAVPVNTNNPSQLNNPSGNTSPERPNQPPAQNSENTNPPSSGETVSEPASDESSGEISSEEATTEPESTEKPEQTDTDAEMEV